MTTDDPTYHVTPIRWLIVMLILVGALLLLLGVAVLPLIFLGGHLLTNWLSGRTIGYGYEWIMLTIVILWLIPALMLATRAGSAIQIVRRHLALRGAAIACTDEGLVIYGRKGQERHRWADMIGGSVTRSYFHIVFKEEHEQVLITISLELVGREAINSLSKTAAYYLAHIGDTHGRSLYCRGAEQM